MKEALEHALERGTAAFTQARRQLPHERAAVLQRAVVLVEDRQEALAALVVKEARKPVKLARLEVQRLRQTLAFGANEALNLAGETLAMEVSPAGRGHRGWAQRVPIGLVLGVTPFNFPLNLVAHKIVPAVATGNAILIKPSPRAPRSAEALAQILAEAGAVENQVQVLDFPPEQVAPLLGDARVKMLSFTGSSAVGWALKAQCVRPRVTLELGGNAAVIVHADARWREAIPLIAQGAFGYAGQSCISVQRVLVQETIEAEFRAAFLAHVAAEIKTGEVHDDEVIVGPLIDAAARERVLVWTQGALAAGARLLTELRVKGETIWPLVFTDVPETTKIWSEEAFAPLVVLQRYGPFEEAVARVNRSRFGLQTGVFTESPARAEQAFREIEASAVLVNQVPTFRVENMPYGGVKDSGWGREGVRYAMEEMMERKTMIVHQW